MEAQEEQDMLLSEFSCQMYTFLVWLRHYLMFFLRGIKNISAMSMQHSNGFPRTCPCLTPRPKKLQNSLLKAKGQPKPVELSGHWWTCPRHDLDTHALRNHCPGQWFDGLGASYTFRVSQAAQNGKWDYLQQQRRAGHLLQAAISQLLQPRFCPTKVLRGYTQWNWMHLN